MTKKEVVMKAREKLVKLQFYNLQAEKTFGKSIAADMFHQDLDYLGSLLLLLEQVDDGSENHLDLTPLNRKDDE